ncbi:TAXI family TRAP transporter solute-binding subunit [Elioraea sp.]|uniref:TAXI family TRAP transporter solute-binding subunit n=1 Tax=Elioraea sp. TaxID=2185103 RepID=UPI0025C3ABD9|nr:TAXI family TRAP transporter solute-binding subunit [Elioraea sp.]
MWTSIRAFLKVYGLAGLLLAAALVAAWQFVAPPPPRTIIIAAGPEGGAYLPAARRWAAILARQGVRAELLTTDGTVENLRLVTASPPLADLALAQGGVGSDETMPQLTALGAIAHEGVWVFRRRDLAATRLRDLSGLRIAIGPEGSGTRVLARQIIEGSGLTDVTLLPLAGSDAAEALATGVIDAAVFVSAAPGAAINRLLREPSVALLDFSIRTEAYTAAFPFLAAVRLPAGSVSLTEDIPGEDVTLLAPVVQVVAREGIHPQIVTLMMEALTEAHRGRPVFAASGSFPAAAPTDWPLHEDADRYWRFGPSFLKRYLPFWVAVTIERAWVLIIPLVTILLPLSRIAPPLYRWQIERKVYRWYADVRSVEDALKDDGASADRDALLARLDRIAARVATTHVPLAYARPLYDLRQHIAFVRGLVGGSGTSQP